MLSDLITNVLKDSAKDIAFIGGMVLLCHIAAWKIKQLVGVVSSEPPAGSSQSATSRSRRSRARAGKTGAAAKPVRNSDYNAGYTAALNEGKAMTASERYGQKLRRKYAKDPISYAAGYRSGIKQKEWHEYVRLVRQEEDQERLEAIRAQIEQKQQELEALREKLQNRTYRNAKNEAARRDIVGV